jgi:predicted Fe-Mo cluster-binding NifX family protein
LPTENCIPTKSQGGLEDVVSDVFGKANIFTIDVEKGAIKNVKLVETPAKFYEHEAGPIVENFDRY